MFNTQRLPRLAYFPSWSWVSLSVPASMSGLEGTFWSAVTTVEQYVDSNTRMRLGDAKGIKVCTLVQCFRYTWHGEPVKIASEVFEGSRDTQFRTYLEAVDEPVAYPPMVPVKFFRSQAEHDALMAQHTADPLSGVAVNIACRLFLCNTVGFFARKASFFVAAPAPAADQELGIQKLAVAVDEGFADVVGHVVLDTEWRRAQPAQLDFVAVARHASNGPHTNLRRTGGWFFHCLLVERVFSDEELLVVGLHAALFHRRVAALFDVDCEQFDRAGSDSTCLC